ncbi:ion channel [Spirosoma fluviale]|uniref:Inward rectifier potassium channel n=1 Tax=Spirosoma fluviale TaxID=1597977 RepID=A0A286G6L3_9BACT|nr:ion channel [Spirosoma fluviale]SOD90759.1 inward rectifier potassium channel [Spirosoma fluviale]
MNTANQRLFNQTAKDSNLVEQEVRRDDIGFGTKLTDSRSRLVNQDGTFNIVRVNGTLWDRLNVYNRLITMGWLQFMGWLVVFYVTANTFFAGVYMLAGPDTLQAASEKALYGPFWKCFFFSSQTLTTVGYGHIAPDSFLTSSIAAFESMVGLLAFALATGLLYGRFSRSVAHIRFSKQAVLAPYLDVNGWMFRIINTRSNQLVNLDVSVSLSRLEPGADGSLYRKYYGLSLERSKVAFFPTNWTIVHPITEKSPLYGCTPEELERSDAEFLISLQALDDTFVQSVHTRFSYRFNEVLWGYKFRPMFDGTEGMPVKLDLNKLDDVQEAPLN